MKKVLFCKTRHIMIWMIVASLFMPLSSAMAKKGGSHKSQVKVMTRNLYLGADIFRVVAAALNPNPNPDGLDVPRAVTEVFSIMQMTNFEERAKAIADEILRTRPDAIGIQEASTYYLQTPSDFRDGNPVQADTVFIDFYSVLDAALKARGLYYDSYSVTNTDIEMPMLDPSSSTGLSDVRLVDHDMILVKQSLNSSLVANDNYLNNLSLDILGQPVDFTRGFVIVDVDIKGQSYRVVNTHLEISSDPGSVYRVVQDIQMQELLTIVGLLAVDRPKQVIMVGDFNSSPDDVPGFGVLPGYGMVPYKPPYMRATDAGFLDAWLKQKKYDDGYTSGFDEYVSDPSAELTTRIDHIFLGPSDFKIKKVKAVVVGDEVKDMTPSGLWPSDHAGVVARIKFSQKKW